MSWFSRLGNKAFWFFPVSAAPFVLFRFAFGLLMAAGTIRFMLLGWIDDHYIKPVFHFHYYGFSWLPVFSAPLLYALHVLLIGVAILFALGYGQRIMALIQFLVFTYLELIDLTYYLNHYYFVSLACFLFCLAPRPTAPSPGNPFGQMPRWVPLVFKFMIALVYFYAGVAKINYDWLILGLPLKIWLPAHNTIPLLGPVFAWPFTPLLFSWFGMLYDISIPFLLALRTTRPWAYLAVLLFHNLTGLLFQIGVFPVVMIASSLLFFSPAWHEKLLQSLLALRIPISLKGKPKLAAGNVRILYFLMVFFGFQILFPWRYLLYPGNIFWTEEGYRFSWRVMLMEKAATAQFYIEDSQTGHVGYVNNAEFLNPHQEKQMAMQPDMILQFAHFLGRHYEKLGVKKPRVRAEVFATLNGRPSRKLIDDKVDLMKETDSWKAKPWILAYE